MLPTGYVLPSRDPDEALEQLERNEITFEDYLEVTGDAFTYNDIHGEWPWWSTII